MVPGIGGAELIVIAAVALIVVGPKDLPKLLRKAGQFVGRMRAMADEFRQNFDDMARQSEIDELRLEVEALKSGRKSVPIVKDVMDDLYRIESEVDERLKANSGTNADLALPSSEPIIRKSASPRKKAKISTKQLSAETDTLQEPKLHRARRPKAKPLEPKDVDAKGPEA